MKKGKRVHVVCSFCGKQNPVTCRPKTIAPNMTHIVCPECWRNDVKPPRADDEMLGVLFQAAAGWNGYNLHKATPDEIATMHRAKDILKRGISRMN